MLIKLVLDLQPGEAIAICVARAAPVKPGSTVINTAGASRHAGRIIGHKPRQLAPVVQFRRSA